LTLFYVLFLLIVKQFFKDEMQSTFSLCSVKENSATKQQLS